MAFRGKKPSAARLEDLIIPEGMRAEVIRAVDAWVDGGPAIPAGELLLQRKDGSPVAVYSSHAMQRGSAGPEMFCLDVDLTEIKRIEDELREKDLQFRLAIETSPDGFWTLDSNGCLLDVNEAYCRLSGYRRDELLSSPVSKLDANGDHDAVARHFQRAIACGFAQFETVHRARDGRWWSAKSWRPTMRRQVGGFSSSSRILPSARRSRPNSNATVPDSRTWCRSARGHWLWRWSRSRIASNATNSHWKPPTTVSGTGTSVLTAVISMPADAASLAKSAFLANMSHEIRTPLNAVIGLTHLQRMEPLTAAQRGRLDKIDAAAQHLLAIISDILDLSKIEAGQMQLEQLRTSSWRRCSTCRADHDRRCCRHQGPGICGSTSMPCPTWLRGDPTRLRQALLNYAGNAVKFTEKGSGRAACGSWPPATRANCSCASRCRTPASASTPTRCPGCSSPLPRQTHRPRAVLAAPAWGWPSPAGWSHLMGGVVGADSTARAGQHLLVHRALQRWPRQGQPPPVTRGRDDDPRALLQQRHAGAMAAGGGRQRNQQRSGRALLQAVGLQVDDRGRRSRCRGPGAGPTATT
jgi:PAS domain S-box-containing protein